MLNYSANGPSGYNLTNSLRFRDSANAYLSRTPASAGNRRTFTWSGWVKKARINDNNGDMLFSGRTDDNNRDSFGFSPDAFQIFNVIGGAITVNLTTTAVYRDPSSWYHMVISVDTTQATASNRVKIYVNGSQVTSFTNSTYPAQNENFSFNNNIVNYIGVYGFSTLGGYFDGYMDEINFIDGQALTPSSFGSTNAITGVWQPARYTGTYGTNGFYLNFTDIALTSGSNTGLGKDFSGNGNFWNTNNISVTSGVTYDAMSDVPTLTSATVANYATLNPVDNPSSSNSLANANLTPSTAGASGWRGIRATMAFPTTGKWYYEVTLTSGTNNLFLGIVSSAATGVYHDHADTFAVRMSDCALRPGGATATGTQAGYAVGDIFGVAIDCSTPTVQFYKNGSLNVTYTSPTFDPSKTYFPCFMGNDTGASATHNYNFGQRPFVYTPPTGYNRLNTFNLPTSAVVKGNSVMDATAYTGTNGSPTTQVISSNFQPDFLWFKKRNASFDHALIDTNRGINKQLYSNLTNAEGTDGDVLTAIGASSFTVGNSNYSNYGTLVAWTWKANGGTTSSNTAGSITSTVQANTTSGFSVVTYTGNGVNGATFGHGLGVVPRFIIIKTRTGSSTNFWICYHRSLTATSGIYLNRTDAIQTFSDIWNNTEPTSTVVTLGTTSNDNTNGSTYVAYCWAEIAGFSRFGSYTGNGSSDGPFVFTGFMPKYVMIKSSSIAGEWAIYDVPRDLYNPMGLGGGRLQANTANAETGADSAQYIDFLSNGFKIRNTSGFDNQSGATYIYMAFASNPFKNSNAF